MVKNPNQGDILSVEGIQYRLLIVSNNVFNESGKVIACPIIKDVPEGPLHIPVNSQTVSGCVYCEQMKYFNLQKRNYRIVGNIGLFQLMDISDAIQGIFEYL